MQIARDCCGLSKPFAQPLSFDEAVPMSASGISPALAASLREAPLDFVITGAAGWLGRATLHMLHSALGEEFAERVTALGSRTAVIEAAPGHVVAVSPLPEWSPSRPRRLLVFHYAFLTKDKVDGLSMADYTTRNDAIANHVGRWIASGRVSGMVLPSSGAVLDHVQNRTRDPAAGPYGRLKLRDEERFSQLCERHGCGLVLPRVFNLAGPYINKFESYALASFIVQALQQGEIHIKANRPVLRSYYLVTDLLELALRILLAQVVPRTEHFDTVGTETIELSMLAQRVLQSAGASPARIFRPPMADGAAPDHYVGDAGRIREHEHALGIIPAPLDAQIEFTRRFIESALCK